jgi:hypothetical protein
MFVGNTVMKLMVATMKLMDATM